MNANMLFFRQALKQWRVQGAVLPSSRYLSRRVLERIRMKKGIVIVELGAGTGAFTRTILRALPSDGKLIVFEINKLQSEHLRRTFKDERVHIIEDDAKKLPKYLEQLSIKKADCVVSGLPLADFSKIDRQQILEAVHDNLADNGLYIQFQYLLINLFHIKKLFHAKVVGFEIRNIPPAFLYECRKK